jgi:septal ring factor EnvC (AmiA/AmiB activator)
MGLPHEDISRLQEQRLSDRQASRAAIEKLKEELSAVDKLTEFAITQIGFVRKDLATIRQEITNVAMTEGRITADIFDQIRALQARVTKLEGKGLF